ncbi:MAG: septum formation protein Maf [Bdellovibrio sp.]|nr:septum formation protein Maf [Bdellovibrio sp.]
MKTLILASESPRRKQLLQEAGFSFDVASVKVSEIPDKNLNVNEQILDIARRKARAGFADQTSRGNSDFILISADTEVIFGGGPLGKPADKDDAFRILKLLSGKVHDVITAVCMMESPGGRELSHVETTKVFFKTLSDDEIWTYIESGEPMDKAGAYGIQGLGRKFVERIEGPFDNVVGLPVQAVKNLLTKF